MLFLINAFVAIAASFSDYNFFNMLQLGQYKLAKGYTKSFSLKYILMLLMCIIICIVTGLFLDDMLMRITTAVALLAMAIKLFTLKRKTPLVFTYRILRLAICVIVINYALTFFIPLWLVIIIQALIVIFANYTNYPVQHLINNKFIKQAKIKLNKRSDLIIIGITGSYGKTSTKVILHNLLSSKYKVVSSPNSFNTPLGLAITVNKYLKDDTQVLICEMGARKVGDIRQLCEIVNPKYAILTGIGAAHLQTFKNIDAIVKTKSELLQWLSQDGFAVINSNDECSYRLSKVCKCRYSFAGINNGDIHANSIVTDSEGTTFGIFYQNKTYSCNTRLLGEHNISNILLAVLLSLELGVPMQDITNSIYTLQPVPHRLQMIKSSNCTIIDDSYNANAEGVKQGIKVLSGFSGRKIVISCGIVELGTSQYSINYDYGKQLSTVCNYIFCYGVNSKAINSGAIDGSSNIVSVICASLDDCMNKLKEIRHFGDIIMFTNDLTDDL